ncbi:hypothetical protein SRHO_G00278830 [Serrasalmus rhombeus]
MSLLRPLLLDAIPTIQQSAALALERLAKYNDGLAEAVVKGDVLPWPVYPLAEQKARLQMSLLGTGLLASKLLSELPQMVVSAGGVAAVIDYLRDSVRNACCLGL